MYQYLTVILIIFIKIRDEQIYINIRYYSCMVTSIVLIDNIAMGSIACDL